MDEQLQHFRDYPMGPGIRSWIGLKPEEYSGATGHQVPEVKRAEFSDWMIELAKEREPTDLDELTRLVDELLGMDLPMVGLRLIDFNRSLWSGADFRGLLTEGISSMLASELGRAEDCFRKAQELSPLEPAPYVNLIQILQHDDRWDESELWLKAGFKAEKKHIPLWELYHRHIQVHLDESQIPSKLLELAQELDSWAGMSLFAECSPDSNPKTKANLLEGFYHKGERSEEFLTEFTGAIGVAGEYERIPPLVWQAQKLSSSVSWQLLLHGAQAHLALDQKSAFIKSGTALLRHPELPPEIKTQLNDMIKEVKQELSEDSLN